MCTDGDGSEIADEDILKIHTTEKKIATFYKLQEGDFLNALLAW